MTNREIAGDRRQRPYSAPLPTYSSTASIKGCCCCLFLLLIFLALLAIATALVVVLVLQPKKPEFELQHVGVENLLLSPTEQISAGEISPSAYLSLNILLLFTAVNPNKVGLKYAPVVLHVMHKGLPLAVATVPGFEQPAHSNRTVETRVSVNRFNLVQSDAADIFRDASVNDRVELLVTGDVGAKVLFLGFSSPRVQMASATVEKTAEDLRKEIAELQRQQWEITERLRNPRGLRRTVAAPGVQRPRGAIRPGSELEAQPAQKKRLSSAVFKMDGDVAKDDTVEAKDTQVQEAVMEIGTFSGGESNRENLGSGHINGGFRRDGNSRLRKMDYDAIPTETVPRVLPKEDDPNLVKRNRRMLGQLLGTLEKFREEDKQFSSTEAYMRRSDSLKRAEQKAREESERLRQQEREQISEKRRRDLTLRARVAAKAEEKKLELLFLFWAEHHKKLSNFLRTKAEPPIYYMPTKPLVEDAAVQEQRKEQAFEEWKSLRRKELSKYQKQIEENYISNVDREIERWQNARNARRSNNLVNLQESMDKDLDTHRLEHGPKTRMRNIAGGDDHEDEDVEDINIVEDELMDEVLDPHDRPDQLDATKLPEIGNDLGSGPA